MTTTSDGQAPELEEVFVDGLHLLTSPRDMLSLKKRRKQNHDLDHILRRFWDSRTRERMFAETWKTFDAQVEFRLKREGAPYFAVYGTRGMGKSEVAATIMERVRQAFKKLLNIDCIPAFGRNPSDMNHLLAVATQKNRVAVVVGDETEEETGIGSGTEEDALLDNLETIRVLQHTVIRCANRYRKLRIFSYYCDFVFEVVFQDRDNRVNYCIMYSIDEELSGSDPRIPIGMINMPLHTNEPLRRAYQDMKAKEQVEFTTAGGRRSRVRRKMEPTVDALQQYCIDHQYSVGKGKDIAKAEDLLPKLIFHVDQGDKWNVGEQKLICQETFDRLKEWTEGRPVKEEPESPEEEHFWASDFTWQPEVARMLEHHKEFGQYHTVFLATEVYGYTVYKNSAEFARITGRKKSTDYMWTKRMRADASFQGWLKDTRSRLHEKYLAQRFREAGWAVTEKAAFEYQGLQYEEDMMLEQGKRRVWINAKCGSGVRTYTADEYKTTYILATHLKQEAYVVYLDLEANVHEVYLPTAEKFSVGARHSTYTGIELAETPGSSTPILSPLLSPPARSGAPEAPADTTATSAPAAGIDASTAQFMDVVIALARLEGLDAAEKTLREKGLSEPVIRAAVEFVRARLHSEELLRQSESGERTRRGRSHTRAPHPA